MTTQVRFIPEGTFSNKDLHRLLVELSAFLDQKEVMHVKEAAAFLGISRSTLYRTNIPYHTLEGMEGRLYLKSELIDFIKKH